jgi:hypothetical protein
MGEKRGDHGLGFLIWSVLSGFSDDGCPGMQETRWETRERAGEIKWEGVPKVMSTIRQIIRDKAHFMPSQRTFVKTYTENVMKWAQRNGIDHPIPPVAFLKKTGAFVPKIRKEPTTHYPRHVED